MKALSFPLVRHMAAAALVGAALAGCATGPHANPKDPIEPFNRGVQRFNDGVDEAFLKPVATVYRDVTPDLVRTGVNNFFSNLRDLWSSVNAGLQLRPREATENFLRFSVNTFWGIGGLLDIASEMQIERTTLDFGQTLGRWGMPAGAYVVLPILGPSSVRDTAGLVVDSAADPVGDVTNIPNRNSLYTLRAVDTRARLLGATSGRGFSTMALISRPSVSISSKCLKTVRSPTFAFSATRAAAGDIIIYQSGGASRQYQCSFAHRHDRTFAGTANRTTGELSDGGDYFSFDIEVFISLKYHATCRGRASFRGQFSS